MAQENVQDSLPRLGFKPASSHNLGFDDFKHMTWVERYENGQHRVHYGVERYKSDLVLFVKRDSSIRLSSLRFQISTTQQALKAVRLNDSLSSIYLPPMRENYALQVYQSDSLLMELQVHVLDPMKERIVIVPLGSRNIDTSSLRVYLNSVYQQANLSFELMLAKPFQHQDFPDTLIFANPSSANNRYTQQMRDFRDSYFTARPFIDVKAYHVFVIEGFVDERIKAFMARNKSMLFVKADDSQQFYHTIARFLGHGVGMLTDSWKNDGPEQFSTTNLMDSTGGINLTFWQWEQIQQSAHSFSFYDEDEDLKTNNGMVAYYFWEENEDGTITLDASNPMLSLHRPFKKNYRSYHLNIEDYFFRTLFRIGEYFICLWHIIAAVVLIVVVFFFRFKTVRAIDRNVHISRFWKRPVAFSLLLLALLVYYGLFRLINAQLTRYEVRSGHIKDLSGLEYKQVNKSILFNKILKHKEEEELQSEILVKRGEEWYVKHRKRVLYFTLEQDSLKQWTKARFYHDDDSLIVSTKNFRQEAESHYFVFSYVDSVGNFISQRVHNHIGIDITDKLEVEDASKRILLFVNGYRPTSLGRTFEDNFGDIKNNGLEYPNSKNLIYDFDRYDYWRPWKEIDLLFAKRMNPTDVYYADGHFSVSTSNHRSLINFSSNSNLYPKRCANKKKHTCFHTKKESGGFFGGTEYVPTYDLLAVEPNKEGFKERRENGRVAGKNLLMMLNEFPNRAYNDTVYVVAHSMGYAYSLGILDVLRGKVNFGGFYIIAPENAESGQVNLREWKEVWQYGSKFNPNDRDAPCLQDGVAPQSAVGGLGEEHRIFIPKQYYKRKGYFDSHFIGYYTWIFDIPKGQKGAIEQK